MGGLAIKLSKAGVGGKMELAVSWQEGLRLSLKVLPYPCIALTGCQALF